MGVTKSLLARNASCNATVDLIDTGTTSPYGTLRIFNSDAVVLASLRLSNPAFGNAIDGTAVANLIYDNTGIANGVPATFGFYDRDASFVWGAQVTAVGGGGELELNPLYIGDGSAVSISSARYWAP